MPMWQSYKKRKWIFILEGLRKLTKDIDFKPLGITLLSVLFLGTITFVKYKPVYEVTLAGDTLGYVSEKKEIEKNLTEYINHREGTIALIDIKEKPDYRFELISRNTETRRKWDFRKNWRYSCNNI